MGLSDKGFSSPVPGGTAQGWGAVLSGEGVELGFVSLIPSLPPRKLIFLKKWCWGREKGKGLNSFMPGRKLGWRVEEKLATRCDWGKGP
jgi:hypothetical protein